MRKPAARVGTAGWGIPSRYQEALPGHGSHLERYAQRLNAVEINSSFYRHHQVGTYVRWASSVPTRFRFSVKVPRTLTHEGDLTPQSDVLDRFMQESRGLGRKLGVLLVQLPPRLEFDKSQVRRFFRALRKRIDVPVACEPRHPSWSSGLAEAVLTECRVARVAADPPPWPGADEPGGCRTLAYFRWHGQPRKYYSDYSREHLAVLQQRMSLAGQHATHLWAIFDNTALGFGLGNALTLTASEPRAVIRAPSAR